MQVAVVTPYLPWPADTGGKLRSFYLLKGLAEATQVDLYSFYHPHALAPDAPEQGDLATLCRRVETLALAADPGLSNPVDVLRNPLPRAVRYFQDAQSLETVRARLANGYDLLIADEIVLSPYVWSIPGAEQTPRLVIRHKIDHLHYAETARSRPLSREKALDWLEARRLRTFEVAEMPRFQATVVCSPEDKGHALAQSGPIPTEVIVNGADTDYFTPVRLPDPEPTILFLGTMHYFPNIDSVRWYFKSMHEALLAAVPNLKVLIVGHQPPPDVVAYGERPEVTVTGSVPDVRPYMARSWVQVVPLRLGGGTRLKIVEGMAAGLPVVSTSVGAQGLDVRSGLQMVLADEPDDFVRKLTALLKDGDARERMARAARTFVENHYSWRALGRKYADFCFATVERAQRRVPHV
jgi:glycosyltransferase involved in cell wall biosynthesis